MPKSGEPKQLDQTQVLVKHAEFHKLNEAQSGSAVKRKTRNCTVPQSARKAEMNRVRGAARQSTHDSRTKRTWGVKCGTQEWERGEGWVESEGEAPIKGGCARQTQVI